MRHAPVRPAPAHRLEIDAQRPGPRPHRGGGLRGVAGGRDGSLLRWLDRRLGRGSLGRRNLGGRGLTHGLDRLLDLLGLFALHLQLHQDRAHRRLVADPGVQPQHLAAHRRGDLHRRLVGHHVDQRRVLVDQVALCHAPGHDLRLGGAFAQVGQLELIEAH